MATPKYALTACNSQQVLAHGTSALKCSFPALDITAPLATAMLVWRLAAWPAWPLSGLLWHLVHWSAAMLLDTCRTHQERMASSSSHSQVTALAHEVERGQPLADRLLQTGPEGTVRVPRPLLLQAHRSDACSDTAASSHWSGLSRQTKRWQ